MVIFCLEYDRDLDNARRLEALEVKEEACISLP